MISSFGLSLGQGSGSRNARRRPTMGCRGCGAVHAFGRTKVLRAGPASLTLGVVVWLRAVSQEVILF